MKHTAVSTLLIASLAGCTDKSDAEYRAEVMAALYDTVHVDVVNLVQAAHDLQAASPSHAWDPTGDELAIVAMQNAWTHMRISYEHIEGAVAALFPDTDTALDARYDEALAALGPAGDPDLFDGFGVIGMHGIERILYAPVIRPEVTARERLLSGYQAAAYPATDSAAIEFKTGLVQRAIDDALELRKQWQPTAIELGATFRGLIDLMQQQNTKLDLAATGEEESRYANITLLDLRNNLGGTLATYAVFRDWIRSKSAGAQSDVALEHKLDDLAALYAVPPGDALPAAPPDWCASAPTPANLATPFGGLWQSVHDTVDPERDGSVVFEMTQIAALLGFDGSAVSANQ